ncbi:MULTISPECIES: DUF6278 family protein [Streptomyces]|uniref:DUF6278 family protein n=2 Tax=Streptomyces TaxID=1883 RepID=A0ABS9J924_9ACTN|nr:MULTISPECIES: DUF6278 family protein [Streptomyces]MYU31158.1 hypothetical protein [Streptomyces sp. SID7810]CUW32263.1 hypothetical protein TUE45_07012 [Streptomyces reticuli]MCE0446518.1 DUF6278 family protein [Streptomyces tricolor]MCG0062072.1 DUF6278 family protein [Streptomyces tricolor]OYP14388.1 hypothetical protein CFC35_07520 [Streptomyces sp. FBKL.4005]
MHLPFLGPRRVKSGDAAPPAAPEAVAALLAECELLRAQADLAGVRLDGTPASLEALDQLVPRWRDDPETLPALGHDAGLYLGTVVVRTVPGAAWQLTPDGEPVVRLASGRTVEVVPAGQEWAANGAPELSQLYAEIAET